MSRERLPKESPLEGVVGPTDDLKEFEDSPRGNSKVKDCGCQRSSLYRWYPPLLVVSTVLAGIFCLLYVTKPVRIVAPVEEGETVAPIAEPEPIDSDFDRAGQMVETKMEEGSLDPMLGALPGDPIVANGLSLATRGPSSLGSTSGKFTPMKVDGPRQGLFVPSKPQPLATVDEHEEPPAAWVEPVELGLAPSAGGGLLLDIPDAGHSEFVIALGMEGGLNRPGILVVEQPSTNETGQFEALMRLVPKENLDAGQSKVEPAASIIGEFYAEEDVRSEGRPEIQSEKSI